MAKSYNRYRVRKSINGKCVLQRLLSFPAIIGGTVNPEIRSYEWHDVPYLSAPTEFEIQPYKNLREDLSNEKKNG